MNDNNSDTKSPPAGILDGQKLIAGSRRSRKRLEELNFDPIEKLVRLYEELQTEEQYWRNLRNVSSVQVIGDDGKRKKTVRYSAMAHSTVWAQMEKVANDLLRYGYGRVPESLNINTPNASPLSIGLSGEKAKSVIEGKSSKVIEINPLNKNAEEETVG